MAEPDYGPLYQGAGGQYHIDPLLLQIIADIESGQGRNLGPSKSGASGFMGFKPGTAAEYKVNPRDTQSSVYGAANYIDTLLKGRANGDLYTALSEYGGSGEYASQVITRLQRLRNMWNRQPPGQPAAAPPIVDMTKEAGYGAHFGRLQGPVGGIILHHTAGVASPQGVVNVFRSTGNPAHYFIDRDGTIYQTLPDGVQGQHIQKGQGVGAGLSNANTLGVEIVAKDDADVTPEQIAAARQLVNYTGSRYGFDPYSQVWGHGEVNPPPHRQTSEGRRATMEQLAAAPQPPAPQPGGAPVAQTQSVDDELKQFFQQHKQDSQPEQQQATPAGASPDDELKRFFDQQRQAAQQTSSSGQSLYATPSSPGAQAVGQPIAEGRVPGDEFQGKINLATDPAQKARIAAYALFPDDPKALDRIIVGEGGRLAAVGTDGKPYYIEPAPLLSSREGITRPPPPGQDPWIPKALFPSRYGSYGADQEYGARSQQQSDDRQPWQPVSAFASTPYATGGSLSRDLGLLPPGEDPLSLSGAGEVLSRLPGRIRTAEQDISAGLPGALVRGLPYVAGTVGNPLVGTGLAAGTSAGLEAGRRLAARHFDPRPDLAPPLFDADTAEKVRDTALGNLGFRAGGALFSPARMTPRNALTERPGGPNPLLEPGDTSLTDRSALGGPPLEPRLAEQTQFPGRPPQPVGPTQPLEANPRLLPPDVQLNPAGEAAAESGPYAASKPETVARIPDSLPPLRVPVMTDSQAEARADEIIRWYAAHGNRKPDTRSLIPGSEGGLVQRTGNEGLASLERSMRNLPDTANVFGAFDTAQEQAIRAHTTRLVGGPEQLQEAYAAREAATAAPRAEAFANKQSTSGAGEVRDAFDEVLKGPEGKRPGVAGPLRTLRDLLYTTDAAGNQVLETDPEMLYGVRKAITDSLSPLARGTANDARAAASQLRDILPKLDAAIESGAPGYAQYMKDFAELSKPIDALEYLQGRNLTDAAGNTTLAKVDGALKDIYKQRNLKGGTNQAKSLSDEQVQALENLRDELRRRANLAKGKALGSNTVQNLASNSTLSTLTGAVPNMLRAGGAFFGDLTGYALATGGEHAMRRIAASGETKVRQALVDRLLNVENKGYRALGITPPEPMRYSFSPSP